MAAAGGCSQRGCEREQGQEQEAAPNRVAIATVRSTPPSP